MKFTGSIDILSTIVESLGFKIKEVNKTGNQHQIKTDEGGIINLFISTGTLQFQGKLGPKEKLEARVLEYIRTSDSQPLTSVEKKSIQQDIENKKVFVVHGHDNAAKEQLELILHKLDLNPFVLANTGGGGLTIIEALEKEIGPDEKRARFGIVLLTPDDMGYAKEEGPSSAQPRSRQNVVLEMGMCIASLGRPKVAILKKGDIEVPSDAQGIIYIPFNEHVKETVPKLAERLVLYFINCVTYLHRRIMIPDFAPGSSVSGLQKPWELMVQIV